MDPVTITRAAPLGALPSAAETQRALDAAPVRRALHLAVRNERMRRAFAQLRGAGVPVEEAVGQLLGPYTDAEGQAYFLGEEAVRKVVYRKGQAA